MRKLGFNLFAFVAATAFVGQVSAQPPGGGPGPGGGRPIPPVMAALDADKNGEISDKEIENASKALAALDKNKDGKLTEDELRPEMGRGGEGRGGEGRGGFGGPGGGPNTEEMFSRWDGNKDGKLSKDELNKDSIPERMREMLARADEDKDDSVTKEEMTKMFTRRGGPGGAGGPGGGGFGGGFSPPSPEAMTARMMEFDADKDGKLSKDEVTKYAEQMGRGFGGGRERDGNRPGRPEGEGKDRPKRPQ